MIKALNNRIQDDAVTATGWLSSAVLCFGLNPKTSANLSVMRQECKATELGLGGYRLIQYW